MLMLRRVLVVLASVLVLGAAGAGSALALPLYPFAGQLAPANGSFGYLNASSVAVDDFNGDTYAVDSVASSGSQAVVDVVETATGAQLGGSLEGSSTPAGSFSGVVSVAANNGTGRVYVLDPGHGVLDVFEPSGAYACQITAAATPSASECNGVAGSKTPGAGGFVEPNGIAVDQATGDVYVVDASFENPNRAVDVFNANGEYLRQILLSSVPGGEARGSGVAVSDFSGHVYVADAPTGLVYEFDAAGGWVATWTGANTPVGSFKNGPNGYGEVSVAVDDASGYVYVSSAQQGTFVFDSSGAYLAQFSHGSAFQIGTAVDQATGKVYVSDDNAEVNQHEVVEVFGPALTVPGVTTGEATGVSPSGATLGGTVNPAGVQLSDCRFDYGTDTFYGQSLPCVPAAGSIPADSSDHAVSATLTGLQPGTTYHFRLRASNNECAGCTSLGEDVTLTTPPQPLIDGAATVNVTGSSADLHAQINPRGFDTTYRFEWGTSTSYGTSVPVPDGDIGAGSSDVAVSTQLLGLSTNTTYHWRVVAQNANGIAAGLDHTFIYSLGGSGLPDGRAYEMVTPPQKSAAVIGSVFLGLTPDVAGDGSRIVLSTVQCFGEVASCHAAGGVTGTPYGFSRGSGGWKATALASPATPNGTDAVWAVSADAGTALLTSPTPPVGEEDWYAYRLDGSLVDVGPTSPPAAGGIGRQVGGNAATTGPADLSRVVYQSRPLWPFDASNENAVSLYEYRGVGNSAPVLVGVSGGAGSTDLIGRCGVGLGERAGSYGAVSGDGSRVFFTVTPCASGSGVNAGVAVPAFELYARIDQSRTVAISARSPLECTSASGCSGSPAADASFQGASVDGSQAFFLDTQQLTNTASEDGNTASEDSSNRDTGLACWLTVGANGCNLYEYDFASPTGRNLVAVSAGDTSGGGPRVQGMMGISADGSHAYFIAKGVLTSTPNDQGEVARNGAENLYVFERDASHPTGHVSFIASLLESDNEIGPVAVWTSTLLRANVTPDGRFLVFESRAKLTADGSGSPEAAQVFRYDAQTGQLTRISVGERGYNDNGNTGVGDARIVSPLSNRLGSPRGDPTMSDSGAYVFFESPIALTPGALDDVQVATFAGVTEYAENVYEWHEGHVSLLSDGRDVTATTSEACKHQSSVCLLGVDSTGSNAFFMTADPLVRADTDTQVDVYDARICTSSSPCVSAPAAPVPCQGDACHGTPPAAPPAVGAATVAFSGPGNLAPPLTAAVKPKAKKHTRRAHGKPTARKHKGKRHTQRAHGRPKQHRKPGRGHGHSSRTGGK
jgi:hypothetical protein